MSGAPRDTALVRAIETLGLELVNLQAELHIAHEGGIALQKLSREWREQCARAEAERDELRKTFLVNPSGDALRAVQVYMQHFKIEAIGCADGGWYAQVGDAKYSGETLADAVRAAAEEWRAGQTPEAQA